MCGKYQTDRNRQREGHKEINECMCFSYGSTMAIHPSIKEHLEKRGDAADVWSVACGYVSLRGPMPAGHGLSPAVVIVDG